MRRLERPHIRPRQLAIPFMGLFAALIPGLVAGAQFSELAVVDTTLPSMCGCGYQPDGPEPLQLVVMVHDWGWEVAGNDLALEGRATADSPEELSHLLADVKTRHRHVGEVIVVPDPDTDFGRMVRTMDAARSFEGHELFPWPVLAGGILE